MGKKKKTTRYYKGKDIPKTKGDRTPVHGVPNTNIDVRDIFDGSLIMRQKIGKDGIASRDIDKGHVDHNVYDHVHDFLWFSA